MRNTSYKNLARNKGDIMISVLVFAAIAVTVVLGLTNWGVILLRNVKQVTEKQQALQIAEAGIDYYRWHLAHSPSDFKDGTNSTGPYVHSFKDKNGNVLGTYSLTITPPVLGSTLVTIVSKGTLASTTLSKSIKVVMAIPSLAQFGVIANDNMRFGAGTVTYGIIQSNKGIRFDGVAHGLVNSSDDVYTDPDSSSCTTNNSWAVHTCVSGTGYPNGDPVATAPITQPPSRPDVFLAGRKINVPAFDFTSLTSNLSQLKTSAQNGGFYKSGSQYNGSAAQGYHVVLKTNDTFDLYVVRSLQSPGNSCSSNSTSQGQSQWGLWSIKTPLTSSSNQSLVGNYSLPSNGVMFFEDNVWVDGQINTAHVTLVAAKLPDPGASQQPAITINSNLLYTNTDGSDTIGLIAQGNLNVGYDSLDTQTIDAALVAQNGRVGRYYYASACGASYTRSTLNMFGMIATNVRYGFAYTDNTGYTNRNINYDANLLYGPPPSFPLTSSFYTTLSWQEL